MAFLAGFTSGAFITVMACPFEFTKLATQIELLMRRTRLATSPNMSGPMEPKGPIQMAREIYHTRGFRGLYSGFNYHFGMYLLDFINDERVMLREQEYISPLMRV
jgi:solute carrier family 25 (mitochondrial carnitine/acylcarnitine transporter), member 20/29